MPCNTSCNHSLIEQYLDAWLTERLSTEEQTILQDSLSKCDPCKHSFALAKEFHNHSRIWQQQAPNDWNRRLFPMRPSHAPVSSWWHRGSLLVTGLALILVLLNTHVTIDNGIHITLGVSNSSDTKQILENELVLARNEYQLATTQLLQDFVDNQARQQQFVLSTILEQSRKERGEELNLLYSTWLDQRQSDQQDINQRFNFMMNNQIESNQYLNTLARTVSSTTR